MRTYVLIPKEGGGNAIKQRSMKGEFEKVKQYLFYNSGQCWDMDHRVLCSTVRYNSTGCYTAILDQSDLE